MDGPHKVLIVHDTFRRAVGELVVESGVAEFAGDDLLGAHGWWWIDS